MNVFKRFTLAIVFAFSIGIVASQDVRAEVTNFPNGISSFGMVVIPGIGSEVYSGNVFFVDSGDPEGSDNPASGDRLTPYSSMNYADTRTTANNGDVVYVLPGHVETVDATADLDLNTAGITWIGLGRGSNRPTIKFTSTTTADMNVDAANIAMINFLFEARVQLLAAPLDINAADCRLINIETRDIDEKGSATNFIVCDANADRLLINGYIHRGTPTAGTGHPISAISLTGGDDIEIRNFYIYGNFDLSGIMTTSTNATRLNIHSGKIWTENSTDSTISVQGSTGWIGPNVSSMLNTNGSNITQALVGTGMQFFGPNPICNLAGEKAVTDTNITASTD